MLSETDLARMVQDFYATVLERENQLRLLGRLSMDEEGRQSRLQYWEEVAEQSRRDLASNKFESADFVAARAIQMSGLTGQLEDYEVHQVQQAMLRGGIDLAQALLARYRGDFGYVPQDPLLKVELARVPENAYETPPSPAKLSPMFAKRAEAFRQAQTRQGKWEKQTALQARKTFELFAEMAGDRPMASYLREDAVQFKNMLRDLPANYGKAAQYRGMTAEAIVSATMEVDIDRLQPRTIQRHINALSTLWEAAVEAGEADSNIFAGFKFPNNKKAHEQRAMWSEDQLQKLFDSPLWTGCQSASRRSRPGTIVIRDERYWLPLVALFSGMRQEEICQLLVTDLRDERGIPVFDINAAPPKKLKNANAVRLVPIHSKLIELGFLNYVDAQRAAGKDRVFHQLTGGGADDRLGHNFSKWFTRYRRDVGVYESALDFHSFRHSATTFMQWSGAAEQVIDKLTGHASAGETARYTKAFQITQLRDGIEGIRPNITLAHLAPNGAA
jgi:integrase